MLNTPYSQKMAFVSLLALGTALQTAPAFAMDPPMPEAARKNKVDSNPQTSPNDDRITKILHFNAALSQEEEGQHDLANYNYHLAFGEKTDKEFRSSSIAESVNYYYENLEKFETDILGWNFSESSSSSDEDYELKQNERLKPFEREAKKGNPKARVLCCHNMLWMDDEDSIAERSASYEWLKSQENDAASLLWLGKFEEISWEGHPENLKAAEKCYLLAAEKGKAAASKKLFYLYQDDRDNYPANPKKALELYTKIAAAGDPFLLKRINRCYKNPAEFYTDAIFNSVLAMEAAKGDPKAKVLQLHNKLLGSHDIGSEDIGSHDIGSHDIGSNDIGSNDIGSNDIGSNDIGSEDSAEDFKVEIDPSEWAFVHQWLVSQENDSLALMWLGNFEAMEWDDHPADPEKAEKYYLKAAANKDASVCRAIGDMYQSSDQPKAEQFYLLAAEYGDASAYDKLGVTYSLGLGDQPVDLEKAEKYYLMGAEKRKNPAGSYKTIANMYHRGPDGKCVDPVKAEKYYLMAAENGDTSAYANLANMYHYGPEGQCLDPVKVEKYSLMAIESGDESALHSLASMYEQGWEGHSADPEKAKKYYQKGAKNQDHMSPFCCNSLSWLYKRGWNDHPADLNKALHWCIKTVQLQDTDFGAKGDLRKFVFPENLHPVSDELINLPKFIMPSVEIEGELSDEEENWPTAVQWIADLSGKMTWKEGEYCFANGPVNERKIHKPEGLEHYKNFGKTLAKASVLLPAVVKEDAFVFMTPNPAVLEHLLTSFSHSTLNSKEIGLRLYHLCGSTVLAFGNENVK